MSVSRFGKQNSEYFNLKFYFVLATKTARNLRILDEKTKGNFMITFDMNPVKGLTVLESEIERQKDITRNTF